MKNKPKSFNLMEKGENPKLMKNKCQKRKAGEQLVRNKPKIID